MIISILWKIQFYKGQFGKKLQSVNKEGIRISSLTFPNLEYIIFKYPNCGYEFGDEDRYCPICKPERE